MGSFGGMGDGGDMSMAVDVDSFPALSAAEMAALSALPPSLNEVIGGPGSVSATALGVTGMGEGNNSSGFQPANSAGVGVGGVTVVAGSHAPSVSAPTAVSGAGSVADNAAEQGADEGREGEVGSGPQA